MVTFINGQRIEFGSAEELSQRNTETVAEFLYVDRAGILAFAEKNALDGGLGNTGYFAHLVGRYIVLLTKLLDSSAVREVQFLDLRSGQTEDLQLPVLTQVYALK